MISALLSPLLQKRRQRSLLLELWREINANLERFYVIDQRQFIASPFDMDAWHAAKAYSGLHFDKKLHLYAEVLTEFNNGYYDVKQYEEMYSSSIDNKTRANAEILHAKKEFLDQRVNALQPHILTAQTILRSMLDNK